MLIAYWQFAESYYSKDGEPTKELESMREALLPLRELYASTAASDFGPKSLKAVRQHMVDRGLCRNVVNRRIGRIKRVFKWAVAEEVVPPSVYHGLQAVPGLRFGRTEARETEPVKPVDDKHVDAVFPYVGIHVAAMIKVQRLTGMRPSDVVKMRPCDIDRSGDVWIYEPYDHKNRWRGHRRLIPIGPRAQEVLKPYLARDPKAFLFSPAESEAWRRQNRPAYSGRKRTTKVYPSELRAREAAKLARRNRKSKRPKVHNVIVWQSNSVRVRPGEKGTRRNRALASKPPQAQPGH
jgi:integrase